MTNIDYQEGRDWFFLACLIAAFCILTALSALVPVLPDAEDCRARGQADDCWRLPQVVGPKP